MEKQKKKEAKSSNGITLIALVISIIIMMVLAGVSINATIGDNGIIRKTKQASIQMGMAALEEWLQQEYVSNHDMIGNLDEQNKVEFLNRLFNHTLLLKDGTRDYIINDGRVYYLLDKECSFIPKEILQGLQLGNSKEYDEYTRLQDVYGITRDLKVYYCSNGLENVYGVAESYDIDPNAVATGINNNAEMKNALTDILKNEYGIEIDPEKGVTLANVAGLKNLEIDGSKYPGITDISALSNLKNLKTLTLSNLNLSNLKGLEGIPNLYYIYLKNTTVGDYTALSYVINLQYLYMYMPSTILEETANNQVNLLGKGLSNADKLKKLEYFGISGDDIIFDNSYVFLMDSPKSSLSRVYSNKVYLAVNYNSNKKSNISNLGDQNLKTGLYAINENIKNSIKYLYLNNNNLDNIYCLKDFNSINILYLFCNPNLKSISGLENKKSLNTLLLQYCNLNVLGENNTGLYGCTNLRYLSLQYNTNLESFNGIKDCQNLYFLLASYCNIKNIDELNAPNLYLLQMINNVNIKNVSKFNTLIGLKQIYLTNNENMDGVQLSKALDNPDTHILKNCGYDYSIPEKYLIYFSNLDRMDFSNKNLNDDSDEIKAIEMRTDLILLKLNDNKLLTQEKVEKIVINNPNLKYLSLYGLENINSLEFLNNLQSLEELDLRGISKECTDLSVLNNLSYIKAVYVNNPKIKMQNIQKLINEMYSRKTTGTSNLYGWSNGGTGGLIMEGNQSEYDFSECKYITKFLSYDTDSSIKQTGTLDLSGTSITNFRETNYHELIFKLPQNLIKIESCYCLVSSLNLELCKNLESILFEWSNDYEIINSLKTLPNENVLSVINIEQYRGEELNFCNLANLNKLIKLNVNSCTDYGGMNLSGLYSNFNLLEEISLSNFQKLNNVSIIFNKANLKKLSIDNSKNLTSDINLDKLTKLEFLTIMNTSISNIININAANLKEVCVTNNKISSLTFLQNCENIVSINLNSNCITDITPLVTAIGEDGVINYIELDISNNSLDGYTVANNIDALLKLKAAGLQKVYITGNNFSANEVNELINGKTIDGKTYTGFGAGNVIN